jgi:adenylate kinase
MRDMPKKVILLTGAPASGKTTLGMLLERHVKPLFFLSYGRLLLSHKRITNPRITYQEMRFRSADIITPRDINAVDKLVLERVNELRNESNVVIDSHPVTKESFGFRSASFSRSLIEDLDLDAIVVLQAEPKELVRRINCSTEARMKMNSHEIQLHQCFQGFLALVYGLLCQCPVFIVETNNLTSLQLASKVMKILGSIGIEYEWTD